MSCSKPTYHESLKYVHACLMVVFALLCAESRAFETPGFIDELLTIQAQGKAPEAPVDTVAAHAADFVDALEYAAGQSIFVPVVEYHVDALEALKFLVVHIDEGERLLPPELEETLTRVALYEGSTVRLEMVYELLDELNALNTATVAFLIEEATGERQHLVLWRTIARHANGNDILFAFLKDKICHEGKTKTGSYARMVLKELKKPDQALLECVLNNPHMSIMSISRFIIEHTNEEGVSRDALERKLLEIVVDHSLDETSRGHAFGALWRHFEGPEALRVTEEVLRAPSNPEILLIRAIRQAKHEGLNKIPDIEVLLEEIVAKSSEGARKEAAAALEWLR